MCTSEREMKFIDVTLSDYGTSFTSPEIKDGEYSGEWFCNLLNDLLQKADVVNVDFGIGYSAIISHCWMEHAFGGLITRYGYDPKDRRINIIKPEQPAMAMSAYVDANGLLDITEHELEIFGA